MTVKSTLQNLRKDAERIFLAGLNAVDPAAAARRYCSIEDDKFTVGSKIYELAHYENIFIIGGGKACCPMAKSLEQMLGDRISGGKINVKYGHITELSKIKVIEAGHPIPDKNGEIGAKQILEIAESAGEKDLVICLISGGGSALLPLPAPEISLEDKQHISSLLLSCGATIHQINAIRKHMSKLKGGRLARAVAPATLISLILSDVVGDDLDVIASGPTVPDTSTFSDCMTIFTRFKLLEKIPEPVRTFFQKGVSGEIVETPKDNDDIFKRVQNLVIGSNFEAIKACEQIAISLGYNTLLLSSMIEGETRDIAQMHAAIAKEILKTGHPISAPACILSGGETTVTIKGNGIGGRNQEFTLAGAIEISGNNPVVLLSGGTDGTDGPTDAAGAYADNETLTRANDLKLDPFHYLSGNDSYHFFKPLNDLLITGPTQTNVMDLRIILVG